MKKKLFILSLILSTISFTKDVDIKVKFGFTTSYGIEGLSEFNIDKENTIKIIKTKVEKPTSTNL